MFLKIWLGSYEMSLLPISFDIERTTLKLKSSVRYTNCYKEAIIFYS